MLEISSLAGSAASLGQAPKPPEVLHVPLTASLADSPEVRPKSTKEIAGEYLITERTIQNTLTVVYRAYPWLDKKLLRIGTSAQTRYIAVFVGMRYVAIACNACPAKLLLYLA